ncbi:MAG: PASTA domain-containing protein [bacterium]
MATARVILRKIFTRKRVFVASILFGILVGLGLLLDEVIMPWYTKHGEALEVPNIVAKRYEVAQEVLEMQGLEAVKAGEKTDPNLPFGYVIEQNPAPNRLVKKGRRVYLTISVGEREVLVPNLVGLSEKNAGERLKSLGLRFGEIDYVYKPNEVKDVVLAQSPEANALVTASSAIDLTVSLGEPTENVTVPSVLGKNLEVAEREIKKAGLTMGAIAYRVSDQVLPNTIIDQSIAAGQVVEHGDTLNLVVTVVSQPE